MARPTKLTDDTIKKLCQAIRQGATYEHACNYAGIDYTTFRKWMIQGEEAGKGQFFEFFNAIKKAEGEATLYWLSLIEKAAQDGNWQAAAWKLERRYPDEYGKQVSKVEHSGEIKASISFDEAIRILNDHD